MAMLLRDVVAFRHDRLFEGAVNVDWFLDDPQKALAVAGAFVFPGPQYHGVTQAEVGVTHGHRLQDTASFARAVVRRCCGQEDEPFALAIAGYGTGKSHLALTLAVLLSNPSGDAASTILEAIEAADSDIGAEMQALLTEQDRPALVVAINGMRSFDLTAEVTRQVSHQVRGRGLDTKRLEELRPRFLQAAKLVHLSNEATLEELVGQCGVADYAAVVSALDQQDEGIYAGVQRFYASRGMEIRALGGESVRDVIEAAATEYCGEGKPFSRLLVLFDEFGRYTEFATERSQVAGSGVLQDLFEGIQARADLACFVGFIQFELNAYAQRVAPELRNEILRYVTRYQAASKVYLSINLETLLASLLEKRDPEQLDGWFDGALARHESKKMMAALHTWFPQSRYHRLWSDPHGFHAVIRKGCWPLSPYATWFLFHLAAGGKQLQERSALALLGEALLRCGGREILSDRAPTLAPVDLWSDELQQELITSEEGGQQGAIAHAYASVEARHGARLSGASLSVLRATVLASKMGLRALNREDAVAAIAGVAGLATDEAYDEAAQLQEEYRVLEWDDRLHSFDIVGDAVPRKQFLSLIQHRVAGTFSEQVWPNLFASKASAWCDLLGDLECDFAERSSVTTREWRYRGVTTTPELLGTQARLAADRWAGALGVDEPRGTIIYCYVSEACSLQEVAAEGTKQLRATAGETERTAPPVLIVLLHDERGLLGQALGELAVLEDALTEEERARFGDLVAAHRARTLALVRGQVDGMIKQRRYITGLRDELSSSRLGTAGTELFSTIYTSPLPFPFDGFSTARGNAPEDCQALTIDLLRGELDYDSAMAKPPRLKNRALAVLNDAWGAFAKTGSVLRRPAHPVARAIIQEWDQALRSEHRRLAVGAALGELCRPPYGANIASAGLLFALFVAARTEDVVIVQDGQQCAVAQWLQRGVFRGKFLDAAALQDTELVPVGEASSEWETLLAEWEQEESYSGRAECSRRAKELGRRIPVPPALNYRYRPRQDEAQAAESALEEMASTRDDAVTRLARRSEERDVSRTAWWASQLVDLRDRMVAEGPRWTDHQIAELQPHIERAAQQIRQFFGAWLGRQSPNYEQPGGVGVFKTKMLQVGVSLKKLGLDDLYGELESQVAELVREAATKAEAAQLVRDVRFWLAQHADACRRVRVAEIRGLREDGKHHAARLQGMSKRAATDELSKARSQLAGFLKSLKDADTAASERLSRLRSCKLRSDEDARGLLFEVDSLAAVFDECEEEQADLLLMRRALQTYQRGYLQLREETLSWREFEELGARLQDEAEAAFAEGTLPWPPSQTFATFGSLISRLRQDAGSSWLEGIESEAAGIAAMSANDANQFRVRLARAPATLTDSQQKRVGDITVETETRLEALEVEGLLERFKGLPRASMSRFLKLAQAILQQT